MNRNQNGRNRNLERPIPGCLGRMVNLFDLNTSLGGNRLLTDKPHYEGSPMSRSQSDVSRTYIVDDPINDKMIVSELGKLPSNRKANGHGTPIKMLIAQEMSKEEISKQNSPNLVAKLMGLDDLPQNQQLNSPSCRTNSRRSRTLSGSFEFTQNQHEEINHYKDVFEIWQQSYKNDKNDKNMALVREKFMEAKQFSTDEKLRQSKQFQDALEVLNSNKDLFLKFLQEPDSLCSQNHNLQTVQPPPDSRRITVLKPSKLINGHKSTVSENKNEKQINENMREKVNSNNKVHNPSQPTRIVVLKPSTVKEIKTVSSPSSLQTSNFSDSFFGDQEDDESQSLTDRRDEALSSSVFSNGYIGDESSFSKSEVYYAAGNLSDSEMMSPISRHSWDYINRFGSPYSSSSFSRASYSPESSVCKEAKKRLSERWAMMSANGNNNNNNNNIQEQRHVRRSSSTLGEMLALSDLKKSVEENNCQNDGDISSINLVRSKSVPLSGSELLKVKQDDNKELTKEKSGKSSFLKGKVSSLFFSKSRKSSKQKSVNSVDENQSARNIGNDGSQCENLPEAVFSVTKLETTGNAVENPEQPSPSSVLELQFEDDDHKSNEHDPIKYNLIDKSPLIGSIARTLSFEDSVVGPVLFKTSTPEETEQECLLHVQTLLSAARIDNEARMNTFLTHFHSPESPLDPSLRENYMNLTRVHNSKQRHRRSFQKLVFDLVNEALLANRLNKDVSVMDHVWACVKEWAFGEERCVWGDGGGYGGGEDGGTTTTLAVERVVRKEVVGEIWSDQLRLQIDDMKKEIEEKLVEQVVEEFVVELLTSRVILGYTL